ncbi:hypothetical protein ACFWM1_26715 [Nocardia sp. NPDC058379]|uniref:hypothetical protein n=1 Tax=unclassified Nocardia TaxID=2637762 RepID=UPI00364F8AE1
MTEPTQTHRTTAHSAVHRRLAAAIQNVAADLAILAGEPRIEPPTRTTIRDLSVANRVLREQAAAVGVPSTWIQAATSAGRQGRRSTGEHLLPAAHAVPRALLVAQLHHQVEALYTLPALAVLRSDRGQIEPRNAARLSEHLRLQWLRVAMTAVAIDATETETHGWFDIEPAAWRPRLDAVAQQLDLEGGRPWRAVTQPAIVREARCRVAAMRLVGISLDESRPHQLPPAPHLLEASAEHAWQTREEVERPAGELIGAAIDATGITATDLDHAQDGAHDLPPPAVPMAPASELDL